MLYIDMEPVKGILFVRLKGKLNQKNIQKLDNEVLSLLKNVGIKNIVFNLSELDCIDKSGKKAIVRMFVMCMQNKGESFICVGENKKVLSIFKNLPDKIVHDELAALRLKEEICQKMLKWQF